MNTTPEHSSDPLEEHGARAYEEIAEAALFPAENPNPVFRVGPDGRVIYANRASSALMATWRVADDGCVPPLWQERLASVLASGEARKWDEQCDSRVLQLHCVPILARGCVNVYASDVTERAALFAELTEERQSATERVEELEALLDLLPAGVAISYDPECKDIRVNPALAAMLAMRGDANVSLSADEEAREAEYRVFDQAGRELAPDELPMQAAAMRGTEVRDRVIDIVREDGTKLTMLSYAVPLFDAAGQTRGAVGAYVDISALRAAEAERQELLEALQERNRGLEAQAEEIRALNADLEQRVRSRTAELEAIFASVPDALYVANANGILRCNETALRGFGCTNVEELREKLPYLAEKMQSRYADTGQPIPPTELGLARALRGERAVLETVTRHPLTGEDQVHRVSAGPIVSNGRVVAAVALATDITEQKRVQQQLAYQANLLARVNDAVIATDLQQRITSWNHAAEAMFGWPEAKALSRPIVEILPTQFVNTSSEEVYRQLAELGQWRGEMIITRRDGSEVYVEATGVSVRDTRGQVIGYVGVNRDITEQKRAQEQIAGLLEDVRASREQLRGLSRRLVAMQEAERSYVADQLYNQAGQVLAALQFQLARLRKEGATSPGKLPEIDDTLNEAIRELHDLATQLRPAGLDRSTLAWALESYVTAFGRKHGLWVRCDSGGTDTLETPKDVGTAIFRAVQEGLVNVVQHASASGVELSLSRDGDLLNVRLSDNGVGFETEGVWRSGALGLASIRERLETVGGQLKITSGAGGTTLHMQAPLST